MRKLAIFAFSFSGAVFLARYAFPFEGLFVVAAVFAAVGLLALILKDEKRLFAMLTAFGLCAGILWSFAYNSLFVRPYRELDSVTSTLSAELADYPIETPYGASVYVKIKAEGCLLPAKALMYTDKAALSLTPGDVITAELRTVFSDKLYGKETDYYTSKGIFLIAYQRGDFEAQRAEKLPIKYYPQYFSTALKSKIAELYDKKAAPFMAALLLGDRAKLNENTRLTDAMSETGITHVVSVSGMHISFLEGLIMLLSRKKRTGALICTPVIIVFMAMVGNTPSVVRAGVMQLFVLFAPIFNRESDNVTALSAALMLLLLLNPLSAANAGLQLSFASVAGIIVVSGRLNAYLNAKLGERLPDNKLLRAVRIFIVASLSTTVGALIFTTPLTAIYFGRVSLVAPISNLCILWAVSGAFLGGLFSVLLGFAFMPAAKIAASVITLLVKYIIFAAETLSKLPLASVPMLSIFMRAWLVFLYAVIVWVFVTRKRGVRIVIPACSVVISFCLCLLLSGLANDITPLSVTALDVGQGQSVVMTTPSYTFVVDCGGNGSANVGNDTADYLWSINRNTIDVLVLTHYDSDHIDGVTRLMQRRRVRAIAVPVVEDADEDEKNVRGEITGLAAEMGIDILYVKQDMRLSYQDTELKLYPSTGGTSSNDRGLIVLCSKGDFDALITGDARKSVEKKLVSAAVIPDIEVLVAGHHGSKYSTGDELLDSTKPETAIISVGFNSYGHPTDEALGRLKSRGISVKRTDIMGNVTVRLR